MSVGMLEIVLQPVEGDGAFRFELAAQPSGATCTIGTGRNADIRLPRPPYLRVGQLACRLVRVDRELVFEALGGLVHEVKLDAARVASAPIEPGEHDLELDGHRFLLNLRFVE
jgi:hypothetical protein